MNIPPFLDQTELIFVSDNLTIYQNGVTRSILNKVRYMEESWGYRPMLLLTQYSALTWAMKDMTVSPDTRVVGMFEYLCGAFPYKPVQTIEYQKCASNENLAFKETGEGVFEGYKDGKHYETQYFTARGGRLRRIERFDGSGTQVNTSLFDDAGQLMRMTLWDAANSEFHPAEYYFTPEKKVKIQIQYYWEPDITRVRDALAANALDHNVPAKYTIFDDEQRPVKTLASHAELTAYCLDQIAGETDKTVIAIDETGVYSNGIALTKAPNIARGAVFHSGFLDDAYNLNSAPTPFFRDTCQNRDLFDCMIFLTKSEKDDFIKKYGFSKKYFIIPHAYADAPQPVPFEKRNGKKVIIVSRFDQFKRVEMSVDIFKMVSEKLPDVTLDIYGFGAGAADTTESIKRHIERVGMSGKVFMKGYTKTPEEFFSTAAMSMMTSQKEGYGMTLAESIVCGCPAFAMNIKFGPSDIIKDGVTGFLFRDGDKTAFANKMVEFLKDENMRRRMSESCYKDAPGFGKEANLERWAALMDAMNKKVRGGL